MDEEKSVVVFCKIEYITRTTEGEIALIVSKEKEDTLKTSIELLRQFEGKDVAIVVMPLKRREKITPFWEVEE